LQYEAIKKKSLNTFRLQLMRKLLSIFCLLYILSCGEKSESENSDSSNQIDQEDVNKVKDDYSDGIYCAEISYFNPETGTSSNYTLNVEVENNEITKIYWPNGGQLDESHFIPEELDENGFCEFTSDKGYKYEIHIKGSRCDDSNQVNELDNFTLIQCAEKIGLTEEELSKYEKDFGINRFDKISDDRCIRLDDYIKKRRELLGKLEIIKNGTVQEVQIVNRYGRIYCQNIIVKRNEMFYWLEVNDSRKCPTGFIEFEPSLIDWQEVKVHEGADMDMVQIFSMKVMGSGYTKTVLEDKMASNCQF
jgi:hypothetical protein